jgi:uncharacterized membrane protein (Fun14 family)
MENLLYILGTSFILYLIYKFAKQVFFKIVLVALIIGAGIFALYYYQIGPFKQNIAHIEVIKNKYCNGETPEICDCIVSKLESDINSRFNPDEVILMKEDRIQSAYVFQKSMSKISDETKRCLKQKDKEELWGFFIKETLQINNKVTNKIEDLFSEGKTAVDDKINETKGKKEEIDQRY